MGYSFVKENDLHPYFIFSAKKSALKLHLYKVPFLFTNPNILCTCFIWDDTNKSGNFHCNIQIMGTRKYCWTWEYSRFYFRTRSQLSPFLFSVSKPRRWRKRFRLDNRARLTQSDLDADSKRGVSYPRGHCTAHALHFSKRAKGNAIQIRNPRTASKSRRTLSTKWCIKTRSTSPDIVF